LLDPISDYSFEAISAINEHNYYGIQANTFSPIFSKDDYE